MPKIRYFNVFINVNRRKYTTGGCSARRFSSGEAAINVFDEICKRVQRERAYSAEDVQLFDYLKDEVGERLADRLLDVSRTFPRAVELGCGRGHLTRHLTSDCVTEVTVCDDSAAALRQCSPPRDPAVTLTSLLLPSLQHHQSPLTLPFRDNSIHLVLSNLRLHWLNDLPAAFAEVARCLRNDGAFLAVMFAADTLYELRCSLQVVETERLGGVASHVSPFTQVADVGRLLSQAGFTLLTIDTDEIVVGYPSIFELMCDLKGMGENSATWRRCGHLHREVLAAAGVVYQTMYGSLEPTPRIPATFQLVYFIGWKPDPSQPRPAGRGSQSHSFSQLQDVVLSPPPSS